MVSLKAIMDYWAWSGDDYYTRAANVTSGNGVPLLDATTVTGNWGGNTLLGSGALALLYTDALDAIIGIDPGSIIIPIAP